MIDIKRGRNVDLIAQEWLWKIDLFFNGRNTTYIDLPEGRRMFHSYAQRLFFQCLQAVESYAIDERHKKYCCRQLRYWWRNLDKIILATPKFMENQIKIWEKRKVGTIQFLRALSPVFVWYYNYLPKEHKYFLINELNLKTCPYCNRSFVHTFKGMREERPELDHFHPKAAYPIFCLSFFNLIPACHSCNHVKLEDSVRVNPYKRAFRCKFGIIDLNGNQLSKSAIFKLSQDEIRLSLSGMDEDEKKNDEVLGLTSVYNKHTDYVKELIDKSMAYDAHARIALVESFQGAGYHPSQVFDFVWGRHLQDAEYEDRPLSKLTKDMLDLLDIN